jgi:putative oxidoreductase
MPAAPHDEEGSAVTTMESIIRARARALDLLGRVQFVAPLLLRIAIGLEFVPTGLGKVQHLDKVTAFFVELHIPMPGFNAVLVGYSELLCGAAILVGLLTRLATIPLVVSMLVALVTAQRDKIFSLDLFGLEEFHYLVMLVAIAIIGPGPVAGDHALARALGKGAEPKGATASPTRA